MFTNCATYKGGTNSKGGSSIISNSDTAPLLTTIGRTNAPDGTCNTPTHQGWTGAVYTTAYNTRIRNPKILSISQETMLSYVDIAQLPLSPRRIAQRRFPPEMLNTVLDAETGELMEYRHLMKNPK